MNALIGHTKVWTRAVAVTSTNRSIAICPADAPVCCMHYVLVLARVSHFHFSAPHQVQTAPWCTPCLYILSLTTKPSFRGMHSVGRRVTDLEWPRLTFCCAPVACKGGCGGSSPVYRSSCRFLLHRHHEDRPLAGWCYGELASGPGASPKMHCRTINPC